MKANGTVDNFDLANILKNVGNEPLLAKSFSVKIFNELALSGRSKSLSAILEEGNLLSKVSLDLPLNSYFDALYEHLLNSYPNEYVFKNLVVQRLLLDRHSCRTSSLLTEFRIATSKADILIINGHLNIYEIKTELDSLDRLEAQLRNYQQFSEFVTVVTTNKHLEELLAIAPSDVGILLFKGRQNFRTIRKAQSGLRSRQLSKDVIFDALRREEQISILKTKYKTLPKVPNTLVHEEYKRLFRKMTFDSICKEVLRVLKSRNILKDREKFIRETPKSLHLLAISADVKTELQGNLLAVLRNQKIAPAPIIME